MRNKHLFLIKAYKMYRNLGLHIEISKVKAYYLAREYGFDITEWETR